MPWLDASEVIDRDRQEEFKREVKNPSVGRQSYYEKLLGNLDAEESHSSAKHKARRKRCIVCGKLFEPNNSIQIFCGEECRKEGG